MGFVYGDDIIIIDNDNKGTVGIVDRVFPSCLIIKTADGNIQVPSNLAKKITRIDKIELKVGDVVGVFLGDFCEVGTVAEIHDEHVLVTNADGTITHTPINPEDLVFIESGATPKSIEVGDTVQISSEPVSSNYKVIYLYNNKRDAIVEYELGSSPLRVALSNLVLADDKADIDIDMMYLSIIAEINDSIALLKTSTLSEVRKEMRTPNEWTAKVKRIGVKKYVNDLLDRNLPII